MIYGIYSWVLVYGLFSRKKWAWTAPIERLFTHHWSWAGCVVLGVILIVWTGIELTLWGFLGLSVVFLVFAIGILGGASLPSVRKYLSV